MLLKIFISGHTPQNVETKLKLGPFHSTTYQTYTNEGAYRGRGLSASSPFRPSGGGAVQEHAYGRKTSPNISWSPRAEGAAAPFHPRLKGGTPPFKTPPSYTF